MKVFLRNMAAFGLSLLACASVVNADDLRELKERIVAAKQEAAELRERGEVEAAEAAEREIEELTMHAKRVFKEQQSQGDNAKKSKEGDQARPEVNKLRKRLHELFVAMKDAERREGNDDERHELGEQIRRTERELEEIAERVTLESRKDIPPHLRERTEHIEMIARRMQHVRVAAENLKAAEMHDMAHELMERAEEMEREIHHAKAELAHEMESGKEQHEPGDRGEIQELRAENQRLRDEMNELREAIEELRRKRDRD